MQGYALPEKKKSNALGTIGTLGGMAAGAYVGGPQGAMTGAQLGGMLGGTLDNARQGGDVQPSAVTQVGQQGDAISRKIQTLQEGAAAAKALPPEQQAAVVAPMQAAAVQMQNDADAIARRRNMMQPTGF